jgi:hypothetical protein
MWWRIHFRIAGVYLFEMTLMCGWHRSLKSPHPPPPQMRILLKCTRGAFTIAVRTNVTLVVGTGVRDPLVQFDAPLATAQLALRTLLFQSAAEPGVDVVDVFVSDQGNSGELGARTATARITLELFRGPYNSAPVLTADLKDRAMVRGGCVVKMAHPPPPPQRENGYVVINDIRLFDPDVDLPRWDKLTSRGLMRASLQCGVGTFDILTWDSVKDGIRVISGAVMRSRAVEVEGYINKIQALLSMVKFQIQGEGFDLMTVSVNDQVLFSV